MVLKRALDIFSVHHLSSIAKNPITDAETPSIKTPRLPGNIRAPPLKRAFYDVNEFGSITCSLSLSLFSDKQ